MVVVICTLVMVHRNGIGTDKVLDTDERREEKLYPSNLEELGLPGKGSF